MLVTQILYQITYFPIPQAASCSSATFGAVEFSIRVVEVCSINDNLCECLLRQSRQYNLLKFKLFFLFQLVFSNLLNGRLRKLNKFIKAFFVRDYNLVHKDMRFVSTRHFGSCCSRHNIVKETILGQCTVDQFLISNVICPNYQDISITSPKFVTMKNFLEIWTNVAY